MKLLTLALTATTLAFGLTACSDGEILAGAAGAAAGVIIAGHHHDHGYHRGGGYGRGGYGRGGGWHRFAATENLSATADFKSTDARVRNVADSYDISDYAATYVVRAIVLAQAKDASGLNDLGLTTDDFTAINEGRGLSASKIDFMARKIDMSREATKALIVDLKNDIQAAQ